ncbi:MAG: hypothetical protein QOE92_1064 [Chloroflexota bacterium]|jgi:hypothetical protein|nr:hypothetical protein [Chloroflexota bacterium]
MDPGAGPGPAPKLTDHLRNNWNFRLVLVAMILVPPSVAFFLPPTIVGLGDFIWLSGAWLVAAVLLYLGDETFVPGKDNLSTGGGHKGSVPYRVLTNPLFLLSVAVLVFAPAPLAFYGPAIIAGSPDWVWLVASYVLAVATVFVMYRTIVSIENSDPAA